MGRTATDRWHVKARPSGGQWSFVGGDWRAGLPGKALPLREAEEFLDYLENVYPGWEFALVPAST